jgi:predicted Zn-dependent protease
MYDETVAVYTRAIQALPSNFLVHFAYAEYLELQTKPREAIVVLEKLLETEEHSLVYIQLMRITLRSLVC